MNAKTFSRFLTHREGGFPLQTKLSLKRFLTLFALIYDDFCFRRIALLKRKTFLSKWENTLVNYSDRAHHHSTTLRMKHSIHPCAHLRLIYSITAPLGNRMRFVAVTF